MLSFEFKASEYYPDLITNKAIFQQTAFTEREIPRFVAESIIADFMKEGTELTDIIRDQINGFIENHVPHKSQRGELKQKFLSFEVVNLLDNYSVAVNNNNDEKYLRIPFLNLNYAGVIAKIVQDNENLLKQGVWGIGELFYVPSPDKSGEGQVWMLNFQPYKTKPVDLIAFIEYRKFFNITEWIDLLISSMGINPVDNEEQQKLILLSRLIPLLEPSINLIELSSTKDRSLKMDRFSHYASVTQGPRISHETLFYNPKIFVSGLLKRYDTIMIDNTKHIKDDDSGKLLTKLITYLKIGKFFDGSSETTANTNLVLSTDISLDEHNIPVNYDMSCFQELPPFLQKTELIELFDGVIQDWHLPTPIHDTPSEYIGLKGYIFAELLHELRRHKYYSNCVKQNIRLNGSEDMKDQKAILKMATAYYKLLFPHQQLTLAEFNHYCLQPAIELRQTLRDELHKLNKCVPKVTLAIK
ncbi:MAG: BREX system Lon protease-like protein BrxL [Candidatus Cloacimonetes bacterium]|nr:BREX system Lon protease-like protein BrxL [Candidatus Cloacimonadota bacterium]